MDYDIWNEMDSLNKTGAPGYLEKLEELCKIDEYLLQTFYEIVKRRNSVNSSRMIESNKS